MRNTGGFMLKDIKCAIFDLDGTLIDSMWLWEKVDIDFLSKRGFSLPSDLKECIEHLSFIDTAKYFKERFMLSQSIDEIMDEWNYMAYEQYANNILLKPGAKEYLHSLKLKGIKIALATSNSVPLLEAVLKNNEIYSYFDVVTTTNEVQRGKNFPDIYLLSAEKLGVKPDECIVFEDILPAVLGAKAAGMKVVGVHDFYSEYQRNEIVASADYYIYKYEDINEAG
jgi:HAD superfamily hydrolase (TIGR01509 family)